LIYSTRTQNLGILASAVQEITIAGVEIDKNSSKDEIANVNLFTIILHTYFKIPTKRTYFV